MNISQILTTAVLATPLVLASCASKKIANDALQGTSATASSAKTSQLTATAYMQKVYDNQVYAKNIVGNMSFNLKAGDKDITVPGSVHMRKDQVIRLQLFIPILGTEVGRLEFTPSYVLIVDRMHKEYIKADYTQLDFLKQNGITFYSLQALFWNQLFVPGQQKMSESALSKFTVDLTSASNTAASATTPVQLKNGNMTYTWTTDNATARITQTDVAYSSASHGTSSLCWKYSNFKTVGVKQFPAQQIFSFATTALKAKQSVQVSIKMSEVKTTDSWDTETELSSKYKQVDAAEVLKKIMQM
jgi:hypothetical protein